MKILNPCVIFLSLLLALCIAACNGTSYPPTIQYLIVDNPARDTAYTVYGTGADPVMITFEGNLADTSFIEFATDSLFLENLSKTIVMPGNNPSPPYYLRGFTNKFYARYYPFRKPSTNSGKFRIVITM